MTAIAVPQNTQNTQNTTPTARSSGLLKLTLTELKLLTRERVRVALPVAIPLILIIILGNISSLRQPRAVYGGESFIDLYTTIMVVFGLALLALTNVPMLLADHREKGVLRRLQTTPTALQLGTMAAWAVAFGLAAARFFRWE